MHDLVNDLARIASSKLCIMLEENKGSHMLKQSRHMSYSMGEGGDCEQLKPLYKLQQLRTLLLIDTDYSPPLTKRMEKLINLRHLDVSNTFSLKMLLHLSTLKRLQVLVGAKLLLGGHGGLRMEDLGELHNLMHRIAEVTEEFYGSLSSEKHFNSLEKLEFEDMPEWKQCTCHNLSVACGGSQMTYLGIVYCVKLKCLPEHMQDLLPSLNELELLDCPEIESSPEGEMPFSLQQLRIGNCKKLSMLEDGLPSSLSHLTSLQRLGIFSCHQLQSLSLPSSLFELNIEDCPNLQSLSESALLSSLYELTITRCANLQSLPAKVMPSSLSKLHISYCPFLKPLLEFDKGEYWPEIAHISSILIDEEYL
uniref:NB-ARC domain-containing protein n=1 Tax=Solanum lycopersicum TaxID=4081 RepID=A0A3Q7IYV0_SOLLC